MGSRIEAGRLTHIDRNRRDRNLSTHIIYDTYIPGHADLVYVRGAQPWTLTLRNHVPYTRYLGIKLKRDRKRKNAASAEGRGEGGGGSIKDRRHVAGRQ